MENNYLLLSSNKFKTNFIQVKYVLAANEENATYASLLSLYLTYVNQNNPTYKKAINHLDSLYGVNINAYTSLRGDQICFDFIVSFIANRYLNKDQYLNVYEKGALIGMCLDILIREKSNGESIIH